VATANSLGLKKIGDVTVQPENAATLGKIQKISHLVEVQEA
ncbi:MAG: uL30 family ribosomal protein, partial [Ruminococcus callidus]|nr:uL30 family ribosomal protein [Ruminococcus callidus]